MILRIQPQHRVGDRAVDAGDRLVDTLPAPAALVAVAQFDRLVRAGRGAGWHRRAAEAAVFQQHVDLDGRIAAAIENLAAVDVDDRSHFGLAPCRFGALYSAVAR